MIKLAVFMVTLLSAVCNSYATSRPNCDYVQASVSNIKAVATSFGAKSVLIETKQNRSVDESVSFSFVDAKGQHYLGVNHVDVNSCQTEFYNVQTSASIRLD